MKFNGLLFLNEMRFYNVVILYVLSLIALGCGTQDYKKQGSFVHPLPSTLDSNIVLPPSWAFGVLYGAYTNEQETIQRIQDIINHDYPIDAYWIDSWFWSYKDAGKGPAKYIDFIADTVSFPHRKKMWDFMTNHRIKGGFWIWDCILETGNENAFDEFKKRGFFSTIYLNKNSWHNKSTSTAMHQEGNENVGTWCGNIDFDNPKAVKFFKQKMKHFFDEGADFIKLDRTSKISVCKAMFEMSQEFGKEPNERGFMLSHAQGLGDPVYKKYPTKWTDDTRADCSIESPTKKFNPWVPEVAFSENIAMYTDPSKETSSIPFLTNDLGGFDIGIAHRVDEELYIRWLQFSMFCPVTEVFSQPENPTSNLAYLYSERADSIFRFYAHLRMQLFPYIYSYAHLSRLTGQNMIRKISGHIYEFQFGNEFLVAPVHEPGSLERNVFLPEGNWVDYWTGMKYSGGKTYDIEAPIKVIPLFVREGSIIPMRNYSSSIEKGDNDVLLLDVYPGDNSSFRLIEDDGTSNDYLKGIYAETKINLNNFKNKFQIIIEPCSGYYLGMKTKRTVQLHIKGNKIIEAIFINGDRIDFSQLGNTCITGQFSFNIYEKSVFDVEYM